MPYTTLTYNGVEKTLAGWGIAKWRRHASNQAGDNLAFNLITPCDAAEIFPFNAQITFQIQRVSATGNANSFSGGKAFFTGWRVENLRSGSGSMEQLDYKFAGPWEYLFERLVFQQEWFYWNGSGMVADWRSQIVLGQVLDPLGASVSRMTIAQQIIQIIQYVRMVAPGLIQINANLATSNLNGITGWNGLTPLDAVTDITCAEALRKMLRWIMSTTVWFDYTTTPITLRAETRDQQSESTIPFPILNSSLSTLNSLRLKRRDDLIPPAVHFKYRITSTVNGQQLVQIVDDICCAQGQTNASTGQTASGLLQYGRALGAQV